MIIVDGQGKGTLARFLCARGLNPIQPLPAAKRKRGRVKGPTARFSFQVNAGALPAASAERAG